MSTEKPKQQAQADETGPESESEPGPASEPQFRKLADATVMRALAHPTRVRLLYEVGLRGTLTATQAAEAIGGTPAAAAYHLRTLGRYGFIQEAEGGTGRERPWKIGAIGLTWDDNSPDPVERAGARLLSDVVYQHWLENIDRYRQRSAEYSAEVRDVSGATESVFYVTVDEMREIQQEILALAARFQDRITDPALRPPGYLPFDIVSFTYPLSDPPGPDE